MSKQIVLERDGDIAVIQVRRPEALNALSRSIVDEMDRMVEQVRADSSVRVLLFYSEENFAAGADIRDMAPCDEAQAKAFLFTPTYNKIQSLPIPTIAVVDGYAFGGGLELALRCDFRIVSKTAKMGLTELNLGIIPGAGGTVLLPRLVGEAKAKELIYLSRVISGEEAERIGLAHAAVEKEALWETAKAWAQKLCTRSPLALAAAKKSIEHAVGHPEYDAASDYEGALWAELFNHHDQKEGMAAFFEKRRPVFTGE